MPAEPIEGRWDLPEGWRWLRAGDFAEVIGGGTPKNASDESNFDPDGVPWLTPADLSGYAAPSIIRGRRSLSPKAFASLKSSLLPAGSVLISSRAPVGYCVVSEQPIVTNQGFKSLVLDDGIDPFFVRYYVLLSKAYLEEHASGTTFKELSGSTLRELVFPIPDFETQVAIRQRIDTLFAEVAAGEEALAAAMASLGQWRQALLRAAVTGELTADWRTANPPAETGEALLHRILADRRTRWVQDPRKKGKRYQAPIGPDTDGLPELPDGWDWGSLDQICGQITSGSRAWSRYYDKGSSVFVMAQNVRPGRYDDRMRQFVGPPANDPERHRTRVARDDLLLTIVGANTGDLCQVKFEPADHYVCQSVALLRPEIGLLGSLVEIFFSTPFGRALQMNKMIYGAGRPHLSFDDIRKLAVPIPPAEEIPAILSAASEALSDTSSTTAVEAAAGSAALLRQSILAAAFRGELAA